MSRLNILITRPVYVSAFLIAVSGHASAQQMRPLADVSASAAASYSTARCAGLYHAIQEWVGMDRMGSEVWDTTDAARKKFILSSAMIAQQKSGGTLEQQAERAIRDVRNIADLYLARIEDNYAATGQALVEDELIVSDMELCRNIAEGLP